MRLRQAVSMSIDKQAYADTIENRDTFRKQGIDLPVKFNSIIYAAWNGYYLDPDNEKEFGPNAHGFEVFSGLLSGNIDHYSKRENNGELDWYQDTTLKAEKPLWIGK